MGSDEPFDVSPEALESYLQVPAVASDLGRVGVKDPFDLLTFVLMDRPAALAFSADAPLNTDDNAHLEFSAPLYLHYATQESNAAHLQRGRPAFLSLRTGELEDEAYLVALGAAFERSRRWLQARDCYLEALELDPRSERLRDLLEKLVEKSAVD